jgi:hypothetical protein
MKQLWMCPLVLAATANLARAQDPPPAEAPPQVEVTSQAPAATIPGGTTFELHGYARIPLGFDTTPRSPYLVDGDYFLSGFAYTRLNEPDWTELFFSAKYGDYRAKFGFFASLYSDYATTQLADQYGIAQASIEAQRFLGIQHLSVEAGVFWDRFGHIDAYDTYLFGRTHQGGVKARYDFGRGFVQAGAGAHQAITQQNEGMTPVAHLAGGVPVGRGLVSGYLLYSWTSDKPKLSTIEPGSLLIYGADVRYPILDWGPLYVVAAGYQADHALFLAPAVELLHSSGGRGLTENFLGLTSSNNGTGSLYTGALDWPAWFTRRIGLRVFGMVTYVQSDQKSDMPSINRDGRTYLKWGVEPSYMVKLGAVVASVRFDRVILDMDDQENSFRAVSPRLRFPLSTWGSLLCQYSHYFYGDKVQLRPGQVPLENQADTDVFRVQAEAVW